MTEGGSRPPARRGHKSLRPGGNGECGIKKRSREAEKLKVESSKEKFKRTQRAQRLGQGAKRNRSWEAGKLGR